MTQPSPPDRKLDRKLARDVAVEIDRRRMRRRLTLWTALLGLVAAGAMYLRCGGGTGLGLGGGGFTGDGEPRSAVGEVRCTIRMSTRGFTVDGRTMSREAAIAACKAASGVDVIPAGDVRHGDTEEFRAALIKAGAHNVELREPKQPEAPTRAPDQASGAKPARP
jgi:hypothetical protein